MSESEIKLPSADRIVVSSSPHFHSGAKVFGIMFMVMIALLPATLAGIYYFGFVAFKVIAVSMLSCIIFEALCSYFMQRPLEINDGSALLTGLLFALNLPPTTPVWICILGSAIAIGLGKMVYGGIGFNPFNPAAVGRVALIISFPQAMNTWTQPRGLCAVTSATPLQELSTKVTAGSLTASEFVQNMSFYDLFIGKMPGSIGETCTAALLVGGIFLIALRLIRWYLPVFMLLTIALFTGVAWLINPALYAAPHFHLLTGGVMLGAFFMATDPVTSPVSKLGGIIFAIGLGIIISVIRLWGSYPEGVSFAILIMNALTPLIDKFIFRKPFGATKKVEA